MLMREEAHPVAQSCQTSPSASTANVLVLIIGAGLTGLTLACDLARRGVDFRLIEKAPVYFVGSRGKTLQPRSLEVLDALGVIDQILAHGRFYMLIRSYVGTEVVGDYDPFAGRYPTPSVPYAAGLWIPQFLVEEVLRQRLAEQGQKVELATALTYIEQDEQGVTATLQTASGLEQVHGQYLVGADGGRSFVRKFLQIGFAGEKLPGRLFAGDVRVKGLDHEHLHVWNTHPDGVVSLCPFPTTPVFRFQAQVPVDFAGEPSLEIFQQLLTERASRVDIQLSHPTWLSLFQASARLADTYRVGRVLLAGDAAHIHPAAGGQGMNTGIQDTYNLGWKLGLVLSGTNAELLHTYEEERQPVAAAIVNLSTQLRKDFQSSAKQLPSGPEMLQLGINYCYSSLSQHLYPGALPLRAGDRAPDAPLLDAYGHQRRLFDVLRGPRFTLLCWENPANAAWRQFINDYSNLLIVYHLTPGPPTAAVSHQLLADDQGYLREAYGDETDVFYLIRPDGYIGLVGSSSELIKSVRMYLRQLLATPHT